MKKTSMETLGAIAEMGGVLLAAVIIILFWFAVGLWIFSKIHK